MTKKQCQCPECNGEREVECGECGSVVNCEACGGTGYDASVIDLPAFLAASKAIQDKGSSWDLVEDRQTVGRTNGVDSIRFADFALEK